MKSIFLVALTAVALVATYTTADSKGHSGRGHSHRAATFGLSRCHKNYDWRNGHYFKTRICNSVHF